MTIRPFPTLLWFGILLFSQCNPVPVEEDLNGLISPDLPESFPAMAIPADNAMSEARIRLGRQLFYDPVLSLDSTVSCANCHVQAYAFADPRPVSVGVGGLKGFRNAPSLGNVGYQPYLMREGGVPTLEQQVAVPVQELHELAFSIPEIVQRLRRSTSYVAASVEAYDREPDAFVVTRALAAFERTLISASSPWDRFASLGDLFAVSPLALNGYAVFRAKGCAECHSCHNFTDYTFENIGLTLDDTDTGLFRLTGDTADIGRFKVPSLRNVGLTAPYMHDGSLTTLEDVVDHFATGGVPHPNRSERMHPFTWAPGERTALLAFLRSLSDGAFIRDPRFGDPAE